MRLVLPASAASKHIPMRDCAIWLFGVCLRAALIALVLILLLHALKAEEPKQQSPLQVLATYIPESYNEITKQFADSRLVLWRVLLYNPGTERIFFPSQLAAATMPHLKFQNNSRALIIIRQAQKRKWYSVALSVAQASSAGITYGIASGVIKADNRTGVIASGVSAALVLLVPRVRQQQAEMAFNPDWLLSGIIDLQSGQMIEGAFVGEKVSKDMMKTWVTTITVARAGQE